MKKYDLFIVMGLAYGSSVLALGLIVVTILKLI